MRPVQADLIRIVGLIVECYKLLGRPRAKGRGGSASAGRLVDGRVDSLEAKVNNNTNLLVIVAKKLGVEQEMIDGIIGRKE